MTLTRLALLLALVAICAVSPPPAAGEGPAALTVTLVRWPYT
jgi:hypothetical protein